MKIVISGMHGSGKDTIADLLAKKLKLKHYSVGGFRRKMAEERGMTLSEFNKLGEKEFFTDKEADDWQTNIGKNEDNFIIDGRISFHFIPDSIKIFLKVSPEEGAKRIMNANREGEKMANTKQAIEMWNERMISDTARYKKYYNLNPFEEKYYDFVLDTTNIPIKEVLKKVLNFIETKK